MTRLIALFVALISTETLALEPRSQRSFVIDFDLPANIRYDQMYHHFKDELIEMENYWYSVINPSLRDFYALGDNLERFQQANPDVYEAMARLAEVLDLNVL